MGNNVIAYHKNGIKYGMTCAWATMIDYDHIAMLLGSQSVTGNNLAVGDVVGVSALSNGQKEICQISGFPGRRFGRVTFIVDVELSQNHVGGHAKDLVKTASDVKTQ